jgi:hypothetical protein
MHLSGTGLPARYAVLPNALKYSLKIASSRS